MAGNVNRAERRRQASTTELTAAVQHHQAGQLERAEALYRKFLKKAPGDPDALHMLGVIAFERGDADRAIELIGKALAALSNFAPAHSNFGNAQAAAGRRTEACASFRRAIALQPDFAAAHCNLGRVLCEQRDFAAAVESCQRAVELDPRGSEAQTNLGNALRKLGKYEAAEAALRQAAQLKPGAGDLQVNLGNVLNDLKRYGEAASCYRRAINLKPNMAQAHYGLATSLRFAGDIDAAIVSYREAVALTPADAAVWNDLGSAFRALGRFDEAVEAFRRALAINPDFADAYRNLATCQRLAADDPEMARIAALAARADLPVEEHVAASFAVAKALDDADRFDEAFTAYERANRLYREARAAASDRFDAEGLAREVDETIATFDSAFFASVAGWGHPSELPVFIVGMPRSGSSLMEQIAASHSRVFGAGELRDIGARAAELGQVNASWGPTRVRRVADAHLQRLQRIGGGADRVIDKLPDNIFKLGIVATLYPSARIIFCRRDPRDIGLSCFFQKFSPGQLMFSYHLADCGKRYRQVERLSAHWHRVLPLPVLDMRYEALVADLEGESRRLINFLGLDWEPACLDFHRTERTVQTASGWQVRQPLYERSVERWRHYERHLAPLIEVLGDAAVAPER